MAPEIFVNRRIAAVLGAAAMLASCHSDAHSIVGVVSDGFGPVGGATVRIQTTDRAVLTDAAGRFEIATNESVRITAWAPGHIIAGGDEHAPGEDIQIEMIGIPVEDNPDYAWLSAVDDPGLGENQACAVCHSSHGTNLDVALPADQWLEDAHSKSAQNPRFLSMYVGTDVNGNQSPPTRYVQNPDYGRIPLRPDPVLPYYGPGYVLDFPDTNGNCAACHIPAEDIDDPYSVDPRSVEGVAAEGVTCDVCHKVWDVNLNDSSGLPDPTRPGVLAYEFRRPPEGHQFFAGPYDDVAPGEDTFSPLQSESAYCAGCHHGVFWDTTIYDSYGEWLASPYSDPVTGATCQDCHMPPTGATVFVLPDQGGLVRDPDTIPGHLMPGATDKALLRSAVTMSVDAGHNGDRVTVTVEIFNNRTGHHVPTDSPLRHLILLVDATGEDGQALRLIDGPTVPAWGGIGDAAVGRYAGLPGTAYAKVLEELWTEVSPTGAYWNPTRVLSDNRIPAMGKDVTTYVFAAPRDGDPSIDVTLLFRRAFIDLADQKGWDDADIPMAEASLTLSES